MFYKASYGPLGAPKKNTFLAGLSANIVQPQAQQSSQLLSHSIFGSTVEIETTLSAGAHGGAFAPPLFEGE